LDERLLHRTLFFTDAVFAIVMTLLVLDLKPPEHGLDRPALISLINHGIAFLMSFTIIAIFWIAHMSTTRKLVRFDWGVAIANLFFLLPVCLVPFVSSWGFIDPTGWAVYCAVMMSVSAANIVLVLVATRGGGRLEGGVTGRERIRRVLRGSSPGLAFGIGLILALSGYDRQSMWCGALIPVFLTAIRWLFRDPKPAAAAA
jgi:hypothetical protein